MEERSKNFRDFEKVVRNSLEKGNSISFSPAGKSMLPTIRSKKDLIIVSPFNKIEKYDVVLYLRKNGSIILHRVVKVIDEDNFVMCGDFQFLLEYPVNKSQILGVVTSIERNGKIIDCKKRNFLYNLYVHIWDLRLVLDKGLYFLKKLKNI